MINSTESLKISQKIADSICRQAFWYEDKCNWTGIYHNSQIANTETVLRALPSNFYVGSAGVAFFLSAMFDSFQDENYKKTAMGAWEKTISQIPKIRPENIGFYEGLGGIAYSLVQSGKWLKSEILISEGLQLAQKLAGSFQNAGFDVMEGVSGAIISLAAIQRELPNEKFEDIICSGGEYLLANASQNKNGVSWQTLSTKGPNLTGYSQGNAGIIHALSEVYAVSRDSKYLEAIERGISYENSYYSEKYNNWKDLRSLHQPHSRVSTGDGYNTNAWCHGAAGIGLSRLRTYQLTNQDFILDDISKASKTLLNKSFENNQIFSLCHGLLGDLYTLNTLNLFLKENEITEKIEDGFNKLTPLMESLTFPDSKNHLLQNPSFMQGWAGIGYFFLSISSQKLPNVFILGN
jgi:lantibiotic biosynthesis protein